MMWEDLSAAPADSFLSFIDAQHRSFVADRTLGRRGAFFMLACLTSDIRFTNILEGTVTAETCGLTAFAALARQSAAAFAHRTQTVLNAISVDDTTLVEVAFSAIVAKDLPNGWTAGKTVAVMGTSLFQLQQGKIARIVDQHG